MSQTFVLLIALDIILSIMIILKLIAVVLSIIAAIFCGKRLYYSILNLKALNSFRKNPNPINQRHGMVFNKTTEQLEADQSPILPYE